MFFQSLRYYMTSLSEGAKMTMKFTYEESVQKLNLLQSNKSTLDQLYKDIKSGKKQSHLQQMEKFLQRSEIALADLDRLAVIHIAGTKGKGSTSALCESILRHHGFKTGFYSSPHLVVVRERIRINGDIISEEKFSQYFSDIYKRLDATKNNPDDMPKYFHFLTVMAFYTFIREKVDAVILETGIGGTDDSTNIIRNPYVVGITSLGLDHTSLLGNTIEEIAKAKAGIMKTGCHAYTVDHPENAMRVLQQRALQINSLLHLAPDYEKYNFDNNVSPKLQVNSEVYQTNTSLAVQLSHCWMRENSMRLNNTTSNEIVSELNGNHTETENIILKIPKETIDGISKCFWPGRYHIMDIGFAKLYLDGAHTKESMDTCVNWYNESKRCNSTKTLIFSATGDRDFQSLLESLSIVTFDSIRFVVPVTYKEINVKSDTYSINHHTDLVSRCRTFAEKWTSLNGTAANVSVHECIWDAFVEIRKTYENDKIQSSVLVTGSLYLVGGVLAIFNPDLKHKL